MRPYLRGTKNVSNSDIWKQFSSSAEDYAWERFTVFYSDFYLYSKSGNDFVIYIHRCQNLTKISNCFHIKQKASRSFLLIDSSLFETQYFLSFHFVRNTIMPYCHNVYCRHSQKLQWKPKHKCFSASDFKIPALYPGTLSAVERGLKSLQKN